MLFCCCCYCCCSTIHFLGGIRSRVVDQLWDRFFLVAQASELRIATLFALGARFALGVDRNTDEVSKRVVANQIYLEPAIRNSPLRDTAPNLVNPLAGEDGKVEHHDALARGVHAVDHVLVDVVTLIPPAADQLRNLVLHVNRIGTGGIIVQILSGVQVNLRVVALVVTSLATVRIYLGQLSQIVIPGLDEENTISNR